MIAGIWRKHQKLAIAAGCILAVVVIVSAALLVSATPGRAVAGVSPSVSPSPSTVAAVSMVPSPSPSDLAAVASPSPSPTGLPSGWAYSDLDGVPCPDRETAEDDSLRG